VYTVGFPGGQSWRGWPERSSAGLLGPGHPCGDAAVLLELFGVTWFELSHG
jgi:hypothetical protein